MCWRRHGWLSNLRQTESIGREPHAERSMSGVGRVVPQLTHAERFLSGSRQGVGRVVPSFDSRQALQEWGRQGGPIDLYSRQALMWVSRQGGSCGGTYFTRGCMRAKHVGTSSRGRCLRLVQRNGIRTLWCLTLPLHSFITGGRFSILSTLEGPLVRGSDRRQNGGAPTPGLRCFLCQGRHRVAECPQRSALTTLRATAQDPKQDGAPSGNADEGLARVGSIRFLYALQSEQDAGKKEKGRGLMYGDMELNGLASKALIDTGATDTFICPEVAERCNLKLTRGVGRVKAVNSGAVVIWGNTKDMKTKIGSWEGKVSYTVLPMDDFDIVLGLDFMIANQAIPIPAVGCLVFQGYCPGVVATLICHKSAKKSLAAIQVSQGVQESVVNEDVDKLGGGQPADGWAGPQATGMCIRHTIETAPTARVDGGPLWAFDMPYGLGFWLDGQDDDLRLTDCFLGCGQICSRTRLSLPRRGLTSAVQLCDRANRGRR
ncbi:hypothetical protein GQ457_15G013580 [Hibiscus cannabinus]